MYSYLGAMSAGTHKKKTDDSVSISRVEALLFVCGAADEMLGLASVVRGRRTHADLVELLSNGPAADSVAHIGFQRQHNEVLKCEHLSGN